MISAIGSLQQLDNNSMNCLFLDNQSFYCLVCCSTDPSVPPDSSVYNISTTRGTEVTVDLDGLTSGQMYYCKAAATNTTSASCGGPVVGGVKVYLTRYHFLYTSIGMSYSINCLALFLLHFQVQSLRISLLVIQVCLFSIYLYPAPCTPEF